VLIFLHKTPLDNNYTYLADVAEIIKNNSSPNESIFVDIHAKAYNPLVFLSYQTRRNITFASDTLQAQELLGEKSLTKGVFFSFNQKKGIYTIRHFIYSNKIVPISLIKPSL
jgi:hypothetical protein